MWVTNRVFIVRYRAYLLFGTALFFAVLLSGRDAVADFSRELTAMQPLQEDCAQSAPSTIQCQPMPIVPEMPAVDDQARGRLEWPVPAAANEVDESVASPSDDFEERVKTAHELHLYALKLHREFGISIDGIEEVVAHCRKQETTLEACRSEVKQHEETLNALLLKAIDGYERKVIKSIDKSAAGKK